MYTPMTNHKQDERIENPRYTQWKIQVNVNYHDGNMSAEEAEAAAGPEPERYCSPDELDRAQARAEADKLVPVIRQGLRAQFRGQQAYKCLNDSLSRQVS